MTADPSGAHAGATQTASKEALRARIRARRASMPLSEGDRTARALALSTGAGVVACYLSVDPEPGTHALVDALVAGGCRVLVPLLRREPDWAWYAGPEGLRPGWGGIPVPMTPPLGPQILARAEWIWVSGLAATPEGDRLGTGGGWYDRALRHASPDARIGVLLHDGEVLESVPTDIWDRRVHVILTASGTLWAPE